MKINKKLKTLAEFKDQHYGKKGSPKRDKLEKRFDSIKANYLNNGVIFVEQLKKQ